MATLDLYQRVLMENAYDAMSEYIAYPGCLTATNRAFPEIKGLYKPKAQSLKPKTSPFSMRVFKLKA